MVVLSGAVMVTPVVLAVKVRPVLLPSIKGVTPKAVGKLIVCAVVVSFSKASKVRMTCLPPEPCRGIARVTVPEVGASITLELVEFRVLNVALPEFRVLNVAFPSVSTPCPLASMIIADAPVPLYGICLRSNGLS